jgi:hypothetical protein
VNISIAGSALGISVVAALLTGCGATDALPQGDAAAIATLAERNGSWMLPEARGRDLLYISKPFYPGARDVYVYTYPRAKLLGMLGGLGEPVGECVDGGGNVFVADGSAVYEYAHGGTSPIAIVNAPFGAGSCSMDPTSERLAVPGGSSSGGVVSIFPYKPKLGWRFPKTFSVPGMTLTSFCGYDAKGNLYVDGVNGSSTFELAELPKGADAFIKITLSQNITAPGQVQWDGSHLAIGDTGVSPSIIYQFSISGGTGSEVGSTTLGGSNTVEQFWIQGNRVVGPNFYFSGIGVGFWPYPAGGSASQTISLYEPFGAAASLAK